MNKFNINNLEIITSLINMYYIQLRQLKMIYSSTKMKILIIKYY